MNIDSKFTRTRVKICGFTRVDDAICAARLGVDAIGLVFYENSPRYVTPERAMSIILAIPPFVTVVGLFVNAHQSWVETLVNELALDVLQFHGDETQAYCSLFGLPYLKAVRVRQSSDIIQAAQQYDDAQGLLLDAWHPDVQGGTGLQFDWSVLTNDVTSNINKPLILAGGLDSTNIYTAIETTQLYGVDVSSGVESEKGIKDASRMENFLNEVYRFDRTR